MISKERAQFLLETYKSYFAEMRAMNSTIPNLIPAQEALIRALESIAKGAEKDYILHYNTLNQQQMNDPQEAVLHLVSHLKETMKGSVDPNASASGAKEAVSPIARMSLFLRDVGAYGIPQKDGYYVTNATDLGDGCYQVEGFNAENQKRTLIIDKYDRGKYDERTFDRRNLHSSLDFYRLDDFAKAAIEYKRHILSHFQIKPQPFQMISKEQFLSSAMTLMMRRSFMAGAPHIEKSLSAICHALEKKESVRRGDASSQQALSQSTHDEEMISIDEAWTLLVPHIAALPNSIKEAFRHEIGVTHEQYNGAAQFWFTLFANDTTDPAFLQCSKLTNFLSDYKPEHEADLKLPDKKSPQPSNTINSTLTAKEQLQALKEEGDLAHPDYKEKLQKIYNEVYDHNFDCRGGGVRVDGKTFTHAAAEILRLTDGARSSGPITQTQYNKILNLIQKELSTKMHTTSGVLGRGARVQDSVDFYKKINDEVAVALGNKESQVTSDSPSVKL